MTGPRTSSTPSDSNSRIARSTRLTGASASTNSGPGQDADDSRRHTGTAGGALGTRGPALFGADPWKKQVLDDYRRPPSARDDGDPPTVVELLGAPRWRSLWRRTDPLGFRVNGYGSNDKDGANTNPIDRGATEREPRSYLWSVAGHSDYLSRRQYREARDELIDMSKQNRRSRRLRAAASIIRHPFPQRPLQ